MSIFFTTRFARADFGVRQRTSGPRLFQPLPLSSELLGGFSSEAGGKKFLVLI